VYFLVNFIHECSKCAHFAPIMKIICDISYRKLAEQLAAALILLSTLSQVVLT